MHCEEVYIVLKDLHASCLLDLKTDEAFASAQVFYKDLGDIAVENGYVLIKLTSLLSCGMYMRGILQNVLILTMLGQ